MRVLCPKNRWIKYLKKISVNFIIYSPLCTYNHWVFFVASALGQFCLTTEQCLEVNPNSICNIISLKCECKEGFIQQIDSCSPGIYIYGEIYRKFCESSLKYLKHISLCNAILFLGMHLHFFNMIAPSLGEICDDSEQCLMITQHSTCNQTNGTCRCADGYLKVHNSCLQGKNAHL